MKNIKYTLTFILILITATFSLAQNEDVQKGIDLYNGQKYLTAITTFDGILQASKGLNGETESKVRYYRGLAHIRYMQELSDRLKSNDSIELDETDEFFLHGGLQLAYEDMKKAHDIGNADFKTQIDDNLIYIGNASLEAGQQYLNAVYNDPKSPNRVAYLEQSLTYLDIACEVQSNNYLCYDLRGQVFMIKRDSVEAIKDFEAATKLLEMHPPERPDMKSGMIFYRMAFLEMQRDSAERALLALENGQETMEKQRQLLDGKAAGLYNEAERVDLINRHSIITQKMYKMQEHIYLRNTELLRSDLARYSATASQGFDKHMRYAFLLKVAQKPEKAKRHYEMASQIFPERYEAHYEIAEIYMKQAIILSKQSSHLQDSAQSEAVVNEALRNYKLALPHYQTANKIRPCNGEIVDNLVHIARILLEQEPGFEVPFDEFREGKEYCDNL